MGCSATRGRSCSSRVSYSAKALGSSMPEPTCGFEFHLFPTLPFSPYFKPRFRGAHIQPPRKLRAQRIQKILSFQLHQLYPVLGPMDLQRWEMVQHLAARIEVHEVFLAAGIHLQREGTSPRNHERAHIEVVRRDGGDHHGVAIGRQERAATAEGVRGTAGGGGDDETVRPVGVEKTAVQVGWRSWRHHRVCAGSPRSGHCYAFRSRGSLPARARRVPQGCIAAA